MRITKSQLIQLIKEEVGKELEQGIVLESDLRSSEPNTNKFSRHGNNESIMIHKADLPTLMTTRYLIFPAPIEGTYKGIKVAFKLVEGKDTIKTVAKGRKDLRSLVIGGVPEPTELSKPIEFTVDEAIFTTENNDVGQINYDRTGSGAILKDRKGRRYKASPMVFEVIFIKDDS